MFAYIKGTYESRSLDYIVVETNGVGYKIFMSENSMQSIGSIGDKVKVYTYLKVREDDMSIYGFSSNEELKIFELLISVSGVGTKSAIAILSNIEPSTLAAAVVSEDVAELKKLPGIGVKSAQRIILELKDKMKSLNCESISDNINNKEKITISKQNVEELISALMFLGYSRKEIEKVLPKIDNSEKSLEDMIKKALSLLVK